MEQRRVGTFTLGICLVVFGVLFLLHLFVKNIDYLLIFHLWPVILILLGAEILFYAIRSPQKHYQYDFAAILIILLLVSFTVGMAGIDWLITNAPEDVWMGWG